ncbi:MAG: gas vesicle protein K [Isosphaeraceae bacterium]|nr:gas vesicle protein K [Isosphaeraceae bacterium]
MNAETVSLDSTLPTDLERVLRSARIPGGRIELRPDDVKKGLGKLVLTLVELLRQLLERQAIRRVEAGSLTDTEVERLGLTFLQLSQQMDVLRQTFGLEHEDLNIDLGPLGRLL